jgi:hypothetical protein
MKTYGKLVVVCIILIFVAFMVIGLLTNDAQVIANILRYPVIAFIVFIGIYGILNVFKN